MSNGVLVTTTGYYGKFSELLHLNKGVHEAAEERLFSAIVDKAEPGAVSVALGAYWAFYTAWFLRAVPAARAFCVESEDVNMRVGLENLRLNDVQADSFVKGFVSKGWWDGSRTSRVSSGLAAPRVHAERD